MQKGGVGLDADPGPSAREQKGKRGRWSGRRLNRKESPFGRRLPLALRDVPLKREQESLGEGRMLVHPRTRPSRTGRHLNEKKRPEARGGTFFEGIRARGSLHPCLWRGKGGRVTNASQPPKLI